MLTDILLAKNILKLQYQDVTYLEEKVGLK